MSLGLLLVSLMPCLPLVFLPLFLSSKFAVYLVTSILSNLKLRFEKLSDLHLGIFFHLLLAIVSLFFFWVTFSSIYPQVSYIKR